MNGLGAVWVGLAALAGLGAPSSSGEFAISPRPTKSGTVSVAAADRSRTGDVSVIEVSDYVFGNYEGDFPSPPHADFNPGKAFFVFWRDFPYRFVFSQEGSCRPWFVFSSGAALVLPLAEGAAFCVFGDASGYRRDYTRIKEHAFAGGKSNSVG